MGRARKTTSCQSCCFTQISACAFWSCVFFLFYFFYGGSQAGATSQMSLVWPCTVYCVATLEHVLWFFTFKIKIIKILNVQHSITCFPRIVCSKCYHLLMLYNMVGRTTHQIVTTLMNKWSPALHMTCYLKGRITCWAVQAFHFTALSHASQTLNGKNMNKLKTVSSLCV